MEKEKIKDKRKPLISAFINGAFLLAGLTSLGVCISNIGNFFYTSQRIIVIKGLVEKKVISDMADISFLVSTDGEVMAQTYQKAFDSREKVLALCQELGIDSSIIVKKAPVIEDRNSRPWDKPPDPKTRFEVALGIRIHLTDIEKAKKFSESIEKLIQTGVMISQFRITYNYSKFGEIRGSLLEESVANAKEAAEKFAKKAGVQLGSVKKANQGQIQILSPNQALSDTEGYGASSATSIEKVLRVVSTVEFFIHDSD